MCTLKETSEDHGLRNALETAAKNTSDMFCEKFRQRLSSHDCHAFCSSARLCLEETRINCETIDTCEEQEDPFFCVTHERDDSAGQRECDEFGNTVSALDQFDGDDFGAIGDKLIFNGKREMQKSVVKPRLQIDFKSVTQANYQQREKFTLIPKTYMSCQWRGCSVVNRARGI